MRAFATAAALAAALVAAPAGAAFADHCDVHVTVPTPDGGTTYACATYEDGCLTFQTDELLTKRPVEQCLPDPDAS